MKEWFKARNIWGAAITALTDEEAGRVAKAIWSFTMNGEITEIEGAGKGILAMILMTLGQDEERDAEISFKRSMATAGIRNQKKSDDSKSHQMISNDIKCNQLISNDDNKNKNKSKEEEQESESEEYIPVDEAHRIQMDHDTLLAAAESAGFKMSNDVASDLIALYAQYGMTKVMNGLKSCVKHGVPNLAYLEACMKDEPRKKLGGKTVAAQEYTQRDYSDEDAEAMRRMLKVVNSP